MSLVVTIARRSVPVDTFAEASAKVRRYIESRGMGSSGWHRNGNGTIRRDGVTIAHVSYNGRVWEGEASAWTTETREITEQVR